MQSESQHRGFRQRLEQEEAMDQGQEVLTASCFWDRIKSQLRISWQLPHA